MPASSDASSNGFACGPSRPTWRRTRRASDVWPLRFDHRLNVAGAISIAGPAFRFSEVRISDLGNEVATAAQEVSRRLGCQVSTHAIPIDRRVVGRRSSHRAYANVGRGPGM